MSEGLLLKDVDDCSTDIYGCYKDIRREKEEAAGHAVRHVPFPIGDFKIKKLRGEQSSAAIPVLSMKGTEACGMCFG